MNKHLKISNFANHGFIYDKVSEVTLKIKSAHKVSFMEKRLHKSERHQLPIQTRRNVRGASLGYSSCQGNHSAKATLSSYKQALSQLEAESATWIRVSVGTGTVDFFTLISKPADVKHPWLEMNEICQSIVPVIHAVQCFLSVNAALHQIIQHCKGDPTKRCLIEFFEISSHLENGVLFSK